VRLKLPGTARRLSRSKGIWWSIARGCGIVATGCAGSIHSSCLLSGGALLWGIALLANDADRQTGLFGNGHARSRGHAQTMRSLAPVQFFSWLALFSMWIYTTPAGGGGSFRFCADPHSALYDRGANWVGVLFAAYKRVRGRGCRGSFR